MAVLAQSQWKFGGQFGGRSVKEVQVDGLMRRGRGQEGHTFHMPRIQASVYGIISHRPM